jgi:small GTP-binding protein
MRKTKFEFASASRRLNLLIGKTCDFLSKNGQDSIREAMMAELESVKQRKYIKIAFVGQYSSGKSTIISALTGNRDIKIDANVATEIVSEYEWNNIVLMDTPGISAGKKEEHDQRTMQALKECDLIVYVLTSQLFDNLIFNDFVKMAYENSYNDKMLVVINKMSMENGEFEDLKQNYLESIKKQFQEKGLSFGFPIAFIDAYDYIDGFESEDDEFIEISHFDDFVALLNDFVARKGIMKREFDTPIRILRKYLSDIAVSEVDPNLARIFSQCANIIKRIKNDIERETAYKLNAFEDDNVKEALSVSENFGNKKKEEIESSVDQLQHSIENKAGELVKSIGESINENYNRMAEEVREFQSLDSLRQFEQNIEIQLKSPKLSEEERNNMGSQRKMVQWLTQGGRTIVEKSGGTSFLGGISEVAGSQLHKGVYDVGKFFGHNFKPWEAVRISSKIAKFGQYGVPFIASAISMYLDIRSDNEELENLKLLDNAKKQFVSDVKNQLNKIKEEIQEELRKNIYHNIDQIINEFERKKIDILQQTNKNKATSKSINELDGEYVDFIELINGEE